MASGGYRPGAGRRPGIKETKPRARRKKPPEIEQPAKPEGKKQGAAAPENLTPLDFMLKIMNDPKEPDSRRDRMAIAAAPFVHARKSEGKGKKEEKNEKAKAAGSGKFSPAKPPFKLIK